MTVRGSRSKLRMIRRGERITADFLNDMLGQVELNSAAIDDLTTEQPEGEDGEGTQPPIELTETPGTAVWGTPFRIEDASDPLIYIETQNKIRVEMTDSDGNSYILNLEDDQPP